MLAVAALGLLLAAPAQSRLVGSFNLAEIVSPAPNGVVRGGIVRVEVRVAPGVRSFRAWIGSKSVTGSFGRRARNGVRVATLHAGRIVRYGSNRLRVQTAVRRGREDFDLVRFVVARSSTSVVTGFVGRPFAAQRGHVKLTVRLRDRGVAVRVRLNAGRPFALGGSGTVRTVFLDAGLGLRYGLDRITLDAVDRRHGRFEIERHRITVPRTMPIPTAGAPRRTRTGHTVVLDARASQAAHRGSRLRYRWQLVSRPPRSRARLQGAATARPRLRTDRPGVYRTRVTVTEVPRLKLGVATRAVTSAGDGGVVTAVIDAPPVGVQIDTRTGSGANAGVELGAPVNQTYKPVDASKSLQLLVFNRGTLAQVANESYAGTQLGTAGLLARIQGLMPAAGASSPSLVILTTQFDGTKPLVADDTSLGNLNQALNDIGVGPLTAALAEGTTACATQGGSCSAFSAIGVPGLPLGQGNVNPGLGSVTVGSQLPLQGSLYGYLQQDFTSNTNIQNFTFVNGDRVPFDTVAKGSSPQQAVIQVGAQTYTSGALAVASAGQPARSGFYVLVVDAGTLTLRATNTFDTTPSQASPPTTQLTAMATFLEKYQLDPTALVFTQSIGPVAPVTAPSSAASAWNRVANDEEMLGGHKTYFNALDTSGYSEVGVGGYTGLSPWTSVASTAVTRTSGELRGVLARNPSSQFYPAKASALSLALQGPDLQQLAYQPPTPWPYRDSADENTLDCVAGYVRLPTPVTTTPVESNYLVANTWTDRESDARNITLAKLEDYLNGNPSPAVVGCDPTQLSATTLNLVANQLATEFHDVATIQQAVSNWETPFTGCTPQCNIVNPEMIADGINGALKTPASASTSVDLAGAAEAVFGLLGLGEFSAIEQGANVVADGIGLLDGLHDNPDGSDATQDAHVNPDQAEAAISSYFSTTVSNFSTISNILISDWGKMQLATQYVATGGPWAWTKDSEPDALWALDLATQRIAYSSLFPAAFDLWRLQNGVSQQGVPTADVDQYQCARFDFPDQTYAFEGYYHPFNQVPQFGGWLPTFLVGQPALEQWVYVAPTDPNDPFWNYQGTPAVYPSSTNTLQPMFVDSAAGGAAPFAPLSFAIATYNAGQGPNVGILTRTGGQAAKNSKVQLHDVCEASQTPSQP